MYFSAPQDKQQQQHPFVEYDEYALCQIKYTNTECP